MLTSTQFWILAAVLIIGLAAIAWGANKWFMKKPFNQYMALGAGALVGVVITAAVYWFAYKKKDVKPAATNSGLKVAISDDGNDVTGTTVEDYLDAVTKE